METRANYVLIGAFTLAGFVGILGFLLWFARFELDRQFAYYDVKFESVSGLSNASEVRFAGLPVGQVVDVRLDPDLSGMVIVRLEVAADTPVRTSSLATIESLGVTGVSYVGISAGEPSDPLLSQVADTAVPVLPAGRSVLQSISEDTPAILEEILGVARSVSELLGPANQESIQGILSNVEASSANLNRALDDFSSVTQTIATASDNFAAFTDGLGPIADTATATIEEARATLAKIAELATRVEATLDTGDAALQSGTVTLDTANAFLMTDLPDLVDALDRTLTALRSEIDTLGGDAGTALAQFRETGSVAEQRLKEAEVTIATANRVLEEISAATDSFDVASRNFDAFLAGDGTALVDESRTLVAGATELVDTVNRVAETDLPAILGDIRGAAATASRVVDEVGQRLSAAAGRADGLTADFTAALDAVTGTFGKANETLTRLNAALETGDTALAAAGRIFDSADKVLNDEVGTIIASLQDTLAGLTNAIDAVSADVPAITGDLRRTAERADAALAQVEQTTASLAPSLQAFTRDGLPQYTRLAGEIRELVGNLQQLVQQIERDPARYFLGRNAPEFRR